MQHSDDAGRGRRGFLLGLFRTFTTARPYGTGSWTRLVACTGSNNGGKKGREVGGRRWDGSVAWDGAARRASVLTCDCAGTQPWVARVFFGELIVLFNLLRESMDGNLLTSVQNWPA
jgi:hypothetical protein